MFSKLDSKHFRATGMNALPGIVGTRRRSVKQKTGVILTSITNV